MTTHRIRLRGFWTATPHNDGLTRWSRPFGSPRNLTPQESVWLVADGLPMTVTVWVNSQPVGELSAETQAIEVTSQLLPRNVLEILSPDPIEEAFLEIRVDHA